MITHNADGAPVLTERGRADMSATWRYITSPAYALLYSSYRPEEFARASHTAESALIAVMRVDPTRGLYSETTLEQGILAQDQRRRPPGDMDALVAAWRQNGGDSMRAEFQAALQKPSTGSQSFRFQPMNSIAAGYCGRMYGHIR